MKNFWKDLAKPIFVLAPMADVTDAAFRRLIAKYSKTAGETFVMYTEFVSADGLALAPQEGRQKLMRDLVFEDAQRPIVAQFFTSTPEHMEQAAALAQEMGFDGVDINMGCPADAVEKQGAGSKLILNPERAVELIAAAKRGAPNLPVSVKTRLGYNKDVLEEWLPKLLAATPTAIIIHARTRKEMSAVPAHWDRVKRAVEIRDEMQKDLADKTLILGNGDALDIEDARRKAAESGADGVMLGRAIFGRPWLFASRPQQNPVAEPATSEGYAQASLASANPVSENSSGRLSTQGDAVGFQNFLPQDLPPLDVRLKIAVEHAKLFEELLGDIKNFAIMKKHFKAYVEGFDGAKELRMKLMETSSAVEVEQIIEEFIVQLK